MNRWDRVKKRNINGREFKLYRPLFTPQKTRAALEDGLKPDHYAHRYLINQDEAYKIIDTNLIEYLENRGDTSKFRVQIPVL